MCTSLEIDYFFFFVAFFFAAFLAGFFLVVFFGSQHVQHGIVFTNNPYKEKGYIPFSTRKASGKIERFNKSRKYS